MLTQINQILVRSSVQVPEGNELTHELDTLAAKLNGIVNDQAVVRPLFSYPVCNASL
jgi:hypothetical protein